uniref:Uncharacterized protein n=1 Tax=Oryza sativa subsp. japonica TaxID=39947 RepID=Q60DV3_ORYSJ|nr:hypothetical protein [Oryza sativa Japonica Group]
MVIWGWAGRTPGLRNKGFSTGGNPAYGRAGLHPTSLLLRSADTPVPGAHADSLLAIRRARPAESVGRWGPFDRNLAKQDGRTCKDAGCLSSKVMCYSRCSLPMQGTQGQGAPGGERYCYLDPPTAETCQTPAPRSWGYKARTTELGGSNTSPSSFMWVSANLIFPYEKYTKPPPRTGEAEATIVVAVLRRPSPPHATLLDGGTTIVKREIELQAGLQMATSLEKELAISGRSFSREQREVG